MVHIDTLIVDCNEVVVISSAEIYPDFLRGEIEVLDEIIKDYASIISQRGDVLYAKNLADWMARMHDEQENAEKEYRELEREVIQYRTLLKTLLSAGAIEGQIEGEVRRTLFEFVWVDFYVRVIGLLEQCVDDSQVVHRESASLILKMLYACAKRYYENDLVSFFEEEGLSMEDWRIAALELKRLKQLVQPAAA